MSHKQKWEYTTHQRSEVGFFILYIDVSQSKDSS